MRIDVHAHYYPLALYDLIERATGTHRNRQTGSYIPGFSHHVSTEGLIELMAGAGIDRMVMSLGNTPPYYENETQAAEVARGGNDLYADLYTRYPRQFNVFMSVPLPHVDAALAELERALALPGAVGVALGASVLGRPLDDPAFDPFFAELDRRKAVTFVHPVGTGTGPNSTDYSLTWMLGSRWEDTIMAARLILSGFTLRYPNIRFIIPHLGGTLPLFPQRMDNVADRDGFREKHQTDLMPSDLLKQLWYDTVSEHPAALRCACESFGVERIMLGTDWPMLPPDKLKHFVDYVSDSLPESDAHLILDRTAPELLGLAEPAVSAAQ